MLFAGCCLPADTAYWPSVLHPSDQNVTDDPRESIIQRWWQLGHLASSKGGMGMVSVECSGGVGRGNGLRSGFRTGCACRPATLDGHSPHRGVSVTVIRKVQVHGFGRGVKEDLAGELATQPAEELATGNGAGYSSSLGSGKGTGLTDCPCQIRLTVRNKTSSGGHRFKVSAVFTGFKVSIHSKWLDRMEKINGGAAATQPTHHSG